MKYILFLLISLTPSLLLKAQNNDSSLTLPSSTLPQNNPNDFQIMMDSINLAKIDSTAKAAGLNTSVLRRDTRLHEVDVDYYTFVFAQQKKIFSWQLFSAKIILVVVIIVVGMGLFLSYLQFKTYEKIIDQKAERTITAAATSASVTVPAAEAADDSEKTVPATGAVDDSAKTITSTSFEINKDGMKVNSAVIGLIILTVSIVFFFLYLRFVFGIDSGAIPQDALNAAAAPH